MNQRRTAGRVTHDVFQALTVAALVAAIGQVTLGGVVRVTESGLGCPDWPLCHGRIIPPAETHILIEYAHRLSASFLGILIVAVAATAWLFYRHSYWVLVSSLSALALVIGAALLGGLSVITELAGWIVLLHLGIAEALVACMAVVVVVAWRESQGRRRGPEALADSGRFNLLVLATLTGLFALILWGSYMVGYGAGASCATWPLCNGSAMPDEAPYVIHMGHRYLAVLVGVLVVATAASAWVLRAERPELVWISLAMVILFGIQVLIGAGTVWSGFLPQMKSVHLSLATLVWVAAAFLGTLVFIPQQSPLASVVRRSGQAYGPKGVTP